jgi:hypothetical protein
VKTPHNTHRVRCRGPLIYRSASPRDLLEAERTTFAEKYGLRTVVTAAPEEPVLTWPDGVRAIRLGIWKPVLSRSQWRVWKELLDDPEAHPILVHCVAGAERTGILCAHAQVYRGELVHRALRHLRRYGCGLWDGPRHEKALDDVATSLLSLRTLGNVLSDAVVSTILINQGVRLIGSADDTLAHLLRPGRGR